MPTTRREFLGAAASAAALTAAAGAAAGPAPAKRPMKDDISLAAWSINRSFFQAKRWKNADLPRICREEFGINGLEFVNQFFDNPTRRHLNEVRKNAASHGVTLVLIMVDDEGDMAAREKQDRMQAAVSHRKWVDIANYLGCHAIRCNLGGPRINWKEDKDLVSRAAESFNNLLEYARGADLNVIIENHGGASSDPSVLVGVMKAVNNPNFGTLPDFGNINKGDDHYEVIRQLMPYAKGVSAKASWRMDGSHPGWDLEKMLRIAQEAGYHGFYGIESGMGDARGQQSTPDEIWQQETRAVKLTRDVIERVVLKRG